jgi:holliday junction DNA helicase RuvA
VISRIRGTLLRRELGLAEVMTSGGVAYELQIPLTVFERLPREGAEVELRTLHVVREDAVELFGFLEDGERVLFSRLQKVSGVGPRIALNILSTMPPERIVRAIVDKDIAVLKRIPGLGAKKAERLALELADRLDDIAAIASPGRASGGARLDEAVAALVALGYSSGDAAAAVRRVMDAGNGLTGTDVIKAALAVIRK